MKLLSAFLDGGEGYYLYLYAWVGLSYIYRIGVITSMVSWDMLLEMSFLGEGESGMMEVPTLLIS